MLAATTPPVLTVATLGSCRGTAGGSVCRLKFVGARRLVRMLARKALVDGPPGGYPTPL